LSRLRCFGARLDAERGKVAIGGLVLESGRVVIHGEGGFDLGAEELALRLRSSIQLQGGQGVSVASRLEGSFRAPRMGVDQQDTVRPGGTGRFEAVPDPCPAVLGLARAGRPGPMPEARGARPDIVVPPQRPRR
jgi:hypothetical protein